MDTKEVAKAYVELCAAGKFDEAGQKFWAEDVVSLEPMPGEMAVAKGKKAVEGKGAWWYANHEVHSVKVEGPYTHGDQFAVRFVMEVTPKGQARLKMDEIGVFSVKGGKIVEEKFMYGG